MTPDALVLARFGRQRVLGLRTRTRRRTFAAALSAHLLPAGTGEATRSEDRPGSDMAIGQAVATWEVPAARTSGLDWHLRRELAGRLLEQAAGKVEADGDAGPPVLLVWTRPGPAELEDEDAAWWAAAASASADLPAPLLGLAVVTRWGWWLLPEGPGRRWQRLRDHQGRRQAE